MVHRSAGNSNGSGPTRERRLWCAIDGARAATIFQGESEQSACGNRRALLTSWLLISVCSLRSFGRRDLRPAHNLVCEALVAGGGGICRSAGGGAHRGHRKLRRLRPHRRRSAFRIDGSPVASRGGPGRVSAARRAATLQWSALLGASGAVCAAPQHHVGRPHAALLRAGKPLPSVAGGRLGPGRSCCAPADFPADRHLSSSAARLLAHSG